MNFIFFILIGFAITNAFVFLHVFHWFRELISGLSDFDFYHLAQKEELVGFRHAYLGRLVRCHACFGFWVGAFLSFFSNGVINKYIDIPLCLSVIGDGLILSACCFVLWLMLKNLGAEDL